MLSILWKNATSNVVGDENGLTPFDLANVELEVRKAYEEVASQIEAGKLGYAKLPHNMQYLHQVQDAVSRFGPSATDLVVLGIGGSALGNIAIQTALNGASYNLLSDRKRGGPRLFVLDNVDPCLIGDTFDVLKRRLKTTVVNVISKSGETAETASQFMIVRDMLRKYLGDDYAKRIVATTDMERGTLNSIARAEGYAMLPVPPDVGGRFSVLSPVGLFSASMCGVDIEQMLAGAAAMQNRVLNPNFNENPAMILAAVKYVAYKLKGKPMHVMMPYSNRLYMLADWYRQLWAESLGKQVDRAGNEVFVGPTPIKALGTTDQHSQVQLYREGPNDKLTVFLDVMKHPRDLRVPEAFADNPGLSYLAKAKISKLLAAEKLATEYAMAVSKRPSVTIRFDEITPFTVGEFFFLYEFTTSLMGSMLNVNTYDQPAVELGKQATFALMGRQGYEELAAKIKPFARPDKRYMA